MKTTSIRIFIGVVLLAGALSAEDGPRGHWTGTIDVPGHALAVEIDLDKAANGWVGSISIPDQNASGLPLEAITFANGKCSFRIKGAPGEPTFSGTLSADGKTLSGDFTQAGGSMPFSASRVGDAKVEAIKKSPPVAKEFVGAWEGTLEAGQPLRLLLKLANDENGASAVLVSVDQGDAQIPVAAIEQKDTKLTLLVKAIGGEYRGEINKDGTELNGAWTQSGIDIPLKLKKKADASAKP
jgi:hypothetical protein